MIADLIIPFHNRADVLLRCLGALSDARPDASILLVDDASDEDEVRRVRRAVDGWALPVEWMTLPRRSGFVRAVNAAWQRCRRPVSVVLNSDTVPAPGLLSKLLECFEDDAGTAAASPASDNPFDLYQYRPSAQAERGTCGGAYTCVPYLTAMCLAVRREAVAGPIFDPDFSPGYFEDLDLSCRLRTAGWRLAVLESCLIHHEGRATFGLDPHLSAIVSRNYATFAGRWSHLPEHGDLVSRLSASAAHNGVRS